MCFSSPLASFVFECIASVRIFKGGVMLCGLRMAGGKDCFVFHFTCILNRTMKSFELYAENAAGAKKATFQRERAIKTHLYGVYCCSLCAYIDVCLCFLQYF